MYTTQRTVLKFNTAIPSSATVERLFSIVRDILRAKRATLSLSERATLSLSDANFEKWMFMKGNHHHVKTMEEQEDKP